MGSQGAGRTVVEVDARGRVSLAKYGLKNMNVVIDPLEGGGITIQPAVILTRTETPATITANAVSATLIGFTDS